MLRNATWTLSNLCRGKPQPKWEIVSQSLPTLARLIYSTDEEVLTDACWALSYLSDGPNDRIQQVIDSGVCRRLVELLMHGSFAVQTPALRTIGNIVTGDDTQTQFVLNIGILPCLQSLLSSPKKGIKKEACWTISNITAGNSAQIQTIVEADIFPPLISLLSHAEFEIKKEAAWAISNATSGGSPDQLRYLVAHGIVKPLCELLEFPDPKIIMVALEGLENMLRIGPKGTGNDVATQIEEHGGVQKLEALQRHQANEIYEKSLKILETYFDAEDDDQNIAPNVNANTQTYAFGHNPNVPNTFHFNNWRNWISSRSARLIDCLTIDQSRINVNTTLHTPLIVPVQLNNHIHIQHPQPNFMWIVWLKPDTFVTCRYWLAFISTTSI